LGTFSQYVGWGFGVLFPAVMMSGDNNDEIKPSIHKVLLVEAIIACLPLLPGIFVIRNHPEHPPNASAAVSAITERDFVQDIVDLLKNGRVMAGMVIFGIGIGFAMALSAMIQVIAPHNFGEIQIGFVGLTIVGTGVGGGMVCARYLETKAKSHTEDFDTPNKIFFTTATLGLVVYSAFVTPNTPAYVIYIIAAFLGLGFISFVPFAYESLVEATFPIEETLVLTLLISIAEIFALLGTSLLTISWTANFKLWSFLVLMIPANIYLLFFYKTDYNRRKADLNPIQVDPAEKEKLI